MPEVTGLLLAGAAAVGLADDAAAVAGGQDAAAVGAGAEAAGLGLDVVAGGHGEGADGEEGEEGDGEAGELHFGWRSVFGLLSVLESVFVCRSLVKMVVFE